MGSWHPWEKQLNQCVCGGECKEGGVKKIVCRREPGLYNCIAITSLKLVLCLPLPRWQNSSSNVSANNIEVDMEGRQERNVDGIRKDTSMYE